MIKIKILSGVGTMDRTDIVNYLKYSCREGAKFYLLKHSPAQSSSGFRQFLPATILPEKHKSRLKSLDFDPAILDTQQGNVFVDYLLSAEKSGDKIFVSKPGQQLKRVILSDNIPVPKQSVVNSF
jgi:hypothetical protein